MDMSSLVNRYLDQAILVPRPAFTTAKEIEWKTEQNASGWDINTTRTWLAFHRLSASFGPDRRASKGPEELFHSKNLKDSLVSEESKAADAGTTFGNLSGRLKYVHVPNFWIHVYMSHIYD
jgi:hypothetical protein